MSTSLEPRLGELFILELKCAKWNATVKKLVHSVRPSGVIVPLKAVRPLAFMIEVARGASSTVKPTPIVGLKLGNGGILDLILPSSKSNAISRSNTGRLTHVARAMGRAHGTTKLRTGRNVDVCLSLDLALPQSSNSRTSVTSGHDPFLVAKCASSYIQGLHEKQVLACGGHFPGMGSIERFPKTKAMISSKPMASLWREDLLPFRTLLPKLPLIMISHAAYKAYDFDKILPAVWSYEIVTGLLRIKLGYKGVAVADLSGLAWAPSGTELGEAAVKSLEAGCDLLILPGKRTSIEGTLRAIKAALDSGRLTFERLEISLRRIHTLRSKLAKPQWNASKQIRQREAKEMRQFARQLRELE